MTGLSIARMLADINGVPMADHIGRRRVLLWVAAGLALGLMVGALTVGSALPHLINGLGGLDWRTVIAATCASAAKAEASRPTTRTTVNP